MVDGQRSTAARSLASLTATGQIQNPPRARSPPPSKTLPLFTTKQTTRKKAISKNIPHAPRLHPSMSSYSTMRSRPPRPPSHRPSHPSHPNSQLSHLSLCLLEADGAHVQIHATIRGQIHRDLKLMTLVRLMSLSY